MSRIPLLCLAFNLMGAVPVDAYCSLSVRVLSPDQQRIPDVPVSVKEQNGRTIEKESTTEDVKFCDLGLRPVTVTVGVDSCNQTIVRDVPVDWETEYTLTVIYDREACVQSQPPAPVPYCRILLRVSDSVGWLERAIIRSASKQLAPKETDSHGRALFLIEINNQVTGSVHKAGYKDTAFSTTCTMPNRIQELSIALDKLNIR